MQRPLPALSPAVPGDAREGDTEQSSADTRSSPAAPGGGRVSRCLTSGRVGGRDAGVGCAESPPAGDSFKRRAAARPPVGSRSRARELPRAAR